MNDLETIAESLTRRNAFTEGALWLGKQMQGHRGTAAAETLIAALDSLPVAAQSYADAEAEKFSRRILTGMERDIAGLPVLNPVPDNRAPVDTDRLMRNCAKKVIGMVQGSMGIPQAESAPCETDGLLSHDDSPPDVDVEARRQQRREEAWEAKQDARTPFQVYCDEDSDAADARREKHQDRQRQADSNRDDIDRHAHS